MTFVLGWHLLLPMASLNSHFIFLASSISWGFHFKFILTLHTQLSGTYFRPQRLPFKSGWKPVWPHNSYILHARTTPSPRTPSFTTSSSSSWAMLGYRWSISLSAWMPEYSEMNTRELILYVSFLKQGSQESNSQMEVLHYCTFESSISRVFLTREIGSKHLCSCFCSKYLFLFNHANLFSSHNFSSNFACNSFGTKIQVFQSILFCFLITINLVKCNQQYSCHSWNFLYHIN